ncbi:hypothetical protein RP20_CCG021190 [Aedes albopictus]|nr:uncharacterized protein LOC109421670 [Aedes albopictus]KXJ71220.1 hypothetical protein RP20_CCG021190 [Aedes albopictus]
MQLIGETLLIVVLVQLTGDVAAASIDFGSTTSITESNTQRFLINNQRLTTQKPNVGSLSSKGAASQGWFRNTLSVYSRIQPRVGRDTKEVQADVDESRQSVQYSEKNVPNIMIYA